MSPRRRKPAPPPGPAAMRTRSRAASACASRTPRSCQLDSGSIEHRRLPRLSLAALREGKFESRTFPEKHFLPGHPLFVLQLLPFLDGNHHGGINPAPRDHLRPLFERVVDQLAETRFRVLYLPFGHGCSVLLHCMTSQMTSQLREILLDPPPFVYTPSS